jgi:peptidoglycan hydrolase-like protein with peptidoglycan-binding domain
VRPASLLAVAVSAIVGAVSGVAGGLLIDDKPSYPDPLGVGVPLVNQSCQAQKSLLVLGMGDTQSAVASALSDLAGSDLRYLATRDSCHTAWNRVGHAAARYVVYQGPLTTTAACQQRMTAGIQGHLVTRLTAGSTEPVQCLCYVAVTDMPVLRPTPTPTPADVIFIRALQDLLAHLDRKPPRHVTGRYDLRTQTAIEEFQQQNSLLATGMVTTRTWQKLKQHGCPLYPS